ncbi:hypothetical protein [Cohnella rhizosphaerae]|uniref:HEAT repeat domain-containing protein n=1 Tax=Cohnella rhizosphaerae TaxID=1457232 RepID=A0A9X4QQI6_9BACL|nr:hypothetical protein [Cohnella rhizosphaerae]MDG0808061.1 hypothetical protein [Cohnella rhizosphaerae]
MKDLYKIINDQSKSIFTKVDEQVDEFWKWSKNEKQSYEWEVSYPNWSLLTTLVITLLETTSYDQWDQRTINNLLYIIARDNECETIIEKLSERTNNYLFLAEEALKYSDNDARWQFAHYLIKVEDRKPEVRALLYKFSEDYVEYVRKRAVEAIKTFEGYS